MRRHLEDVVSVEVPVECYLSRVGRNGRAPSGVKMYLKAPCLSLKKFVCF